LGSQKNYSVWLVAGTAAMSSAAAMPPVRATHKQLQDMCKLANLPSWGSKKEIALRIAVRDCVSRMYGCHEHAHVLSTRVCAQRGYANPRGRPPKKNPHILDVASPEFLTSSPEERLQLMMATLSSSASASNNVVKNEDGQTPIKKKKKPMKKPVTPRGDVVKTSNTSPSEKETSINVVQRSVSLARDNDTSNTLPIRKRRLRT
jgi:hypothetical protein